MLSKVDELWHHGIWWKKKKKKKKAGTYLSSVSHFFSIKSGAATQLIHRTDKHYVRVERKPQVV